VDFLKLAAHEPQSTVDAGVQLNRNVSIHSSNMSVQFIKNNHDSHE